MITKIAKILISVAIIVTVCVPAVYSYQALTQGISKTGVWQGDLVQFMMNTRDLTNDIQDVMLGDNLITKPGLAIGSSTAKVANDLFMYRVNGIGYIVAADAAGTAPGNDVIPQSTFGAVSFDIGTNKTIDVIEAGDNATGYASAALAIAGIAAAGADHVRMGTVTATKSDGAFTFGTTALNAANSTVAYTDGDAGVADIDTNNLSLDKGQ